MVLSNFIAVFFVALVISPCVSGQETKCSTTDMSATEHDYGFVWKINGFRLFMNENSTITLSRTNLTFKSQEPEFAESYWDFQLKTARNTIALIAMFHPKPLPMGGNGFDLKENFRFTHHISPIIMAKEITNNLEVIDSKSPQYMLKTTQLGQLPNAGMANKMFPQQNVWNQWRNHMYPNSSFVPTGNTWVSCWRNIFPTVNQTFTDAGDDVNDLTIKFQIKIKVLRTPFVDNDC